MKNLFADGFSATEFGPLPVEEMIPSATQLAKAAELISKAKSPLILVTS